MKGLSGVFSIKAAGIRGQDLILAQHLIGDVTENDLMYVECYVSKNMGIFIPSVGFCQYAITPAHTHPSYSFILFYSKEQSFFENNIDLPDEHYLVATIAPGVPHEEKPSDNFTRYIAILIDKDYFERIYKEYSLENPNYNSEWKQFAVGYDVMPYIKKFMSEYQNRFTGYESILEHLSGIICHTLIRSLLEIQKESGFATERIEIENIIEYMHQHFGEKITIKKLAKRASMSESHFIRVFKKETGLSPMDYLIALRIEKAKKLLRAGTKNITEISLLCGFNSVSHFSSSFSKSEGISPSKYQNMYRES